MKRTIKTVALSALLIATSFSSFGALQIRLSDGTPGGTVTVTDGDGNDSNPAPGFVGYFGPVGANWLANFMTQGVSKPAVGSPAAPQMDILTLDSSSIAGGVLTVEMTDTGFTGSGPFSMAFGGNSDGSVTYRSYADGGNTPFGTATPLATLGPSVGTPFSGNATNATALAPPPGNPYSLSIALTINHPVPGNTRVDAHLNVTPCNCVLSCSPNKTNECGTANFNFDPPTLTGLDCGNLRILNTVTNKTCGNTFVATRTWAVTDRCGNTNTCSQTIATVDTTKPIITCASDKTVECGSVWTFNQPTFSDTCGSATLSIVSTVTNGSGCTFTATRRWRATDACGNYAECTQIVTVRDTTAPVITSVPAGGELGCNPAPSLLTVKSQVVATDACNTVTILVTQVDGGSACSSNRTFSIRATDGCNTSAVRTVTYTMNCAPCTPSKFDFSGSSALSGTAGNIRTFTTNGLSVKVSAFSRLKTSATWATAYLGAYGGGLGVTDGSEGDGSANRHTVDNTDRNNYVLFEFSQPVVLNRAFLGYVVTDSDLSVWIGNFTDPFNNHLNLNDSVLGSFGFTEENLTDLTTTRWADVNAGEVVGNAIVIAALTSDLDPEDNFKIELLDLCKRECQPPPPPCVPSTFTFEGNSALDGTDGNVRTFTTNGISVKVSAFSRTKGAGGTWASAYLGLYGGGLGVTDSSEADGSANRHTVDNVDRNNYVLFEFSQPVVLNRAFLGYVVTDSDLSLWVGNFADPFNNHLTLNDSVLGSFGFTEENLTDLSSTRWADVNSGGVSGNAIVIAGLISDLDPEDNFKIEKLDLCQPSQPPPPQCVASICGSILRDCDANGSVTGEAGLAGWTVKAKIGTTVVATATTDASGNYCLTNLAAGTYTVVVTPQPYYAVTAPNGCNDQQTVVVTACQNKGGIVFGYTGTKAAVDIVLTGPASAQCNTTITYSFAVTNTGNTCLYGGMHVEDPLLGGQVFAQSPVSPGQGFVFTKTYVVKTTDAGNLVNTAQVVGHPPGSLAVVSKYVSVTTTVTCATSQPPPAPTYLTATPGCNLVNLSWTASSGATSYNIKRATTKGGPYTTIKTGAIGTTYTDASVINGTVYYYVVSAVKSGLESANSNEDSAFPFVALPSPSSSKDIGPVGDTGGASYASTKVTLAGSGVDIWDSADEFQYAYQPAYGDCTVVARVTSVQNTDPWAKAGVMIRETLTPGSEHASMFITPGNGAAFQWRPSTSGSSFNVNTTGIVAPYWVAVVRSGNTFTGYVSSNGSTWTVVGTPQTIVMGSNVYIGLAVTSHNDGTLCTATFDNVGGNP